MNENSNTLAMRSATNVTLSNKMQTSSFFADTLYFNGKSKEISRNSRLKITKPQPKEL